MTNSNIPYDEEDDWPPRIRPFDGEIIGGAPRYWPNDPTTITLIVRRDENAGTLITGKAQAVTATGERRDIVIDSIPMIQPSGDESREFWRHAEMISLQNVTLEEASAFVRILQAHANDGQLMFSRGATPTASGNEAEG